MGCVLRNINCFPNFWLEENRTHKKQSVYFNFLLGFILWNGIYFFVQFRKFTCRDIALGYCRRIYCWTARYELPVTNGPLLVFAVTYKYGWLINGIRYSGKICWQFKYWTFAYFFIYSSVHISLHGSPYPLLSQLKFHKTHRMKEIDYRKSFCCNATIKFHLQYAQTGSINIYYLLVGCKVFRSFEN